MLPEAEHLPFLRQTQVAAETLAAREADGGGRRGFHGGTSAGGVPFLCICFAPTPSQALLSPLPRHVQSCSAVSEYFVKSNPGSGLSVLPFDLTLRACWSVTSSCRQVLLPCLLLLIDEFVSYHREICGMSLSVHSTVMVCKT